MTLSGKLPHQRQDAVGVHVAHVKQGRQVATTLVRFGGPLLNAQPQYHVHVNQTTLSRAHGSNTKTELRGVAATTT